MANVVYLIIWTNRKNNFLDLFNLESYQFPIYLDAKTI